MNCPNRRIKKRVGRGGGSPNCQGRLMLVINAPIVIPAKSTPKGGETVSEAVLMARYRNHGIRIRGDELIRLIERGKYDVTCSQCDWSMKRLMVPARKMRRKR